MIGPLLCMIGGIGLQGDVSRQIQVDGSVHVAVAIDSNETENRELKLRLSSAGASDVVLRDISDSKGRRILGGKNTYRFELIWGASCVPDRCSFRPVVEISILDRDTICFSRDFSPSDSELLNGAHVDLGTAQSICPKPE